MLCPPLLPLAVVGATLVVARLFLRVPWSGEAQATFVTAPRHGLAYGQTMAPPPNQDHGTRQIRLCRIRAMAPDAMG